VARAVSVALAQAASVAVALVVSVAAAQAASVVVARVALPARQTPAPTRVSTRAQAPRARAVRAAEARALERAVPVQAVAPRAAVAAVVAPRARPARGVPLVHELEPVELVSLPLPKTTVDVAAGSPVAAEPALLASGLWGCCSSVGGEAGEHETTREIPAPTDRVEPKSKKR
jgi:hypothetical protein